jgi:hypothetical protein
MNKEDKYYTPDISEFHVGFEYEFSDWQNETPTEWNKAKFNLLENPTYLESDSWLFNLQAEIDKKHIRVKYLDRKDIESLGFTRHDINGQIECYWINSDSPYYFKGDRLIKDSTINNHYFIETSKNYTNDEPVQLFSGFIKNKSELKTLLKQISIK